MSNPTNIRLLIAEGDEVLRDAFALFFSLQAGFEVVGQVANHTQTRALSQQLKPDVILVDFELQPANLISFIRALRQQSPTTKIVVLAAQPDGAGPQVLEAGASKYVTKGLLASDVTDVIRQAHQV